MPNLTLRILVVPLFFLALMAGATRIRAAVQLERLRVEDAANPLGLDVERPRFSWRMAPVENQRGKSQAAYRVEVQDPAGTTVWDSHRTADDRSIGIVYAGTPLHPSTRYTWRVTIWDEAGAPASATNWFETGLLASDLSAWEGATWIGGTSEDLVLYARYLPLFALKYTVAIAEGSTRAGFVLAANDPRLMDRNKNLFQLQSPHNGSYFKLVVDIAGLDGSENGRAKLLAYRAGYAPQDDPAVPVASFEVPSTAINAANKHAEHTVSFRSELGCLTITVDGAALPPIVPPDPQRRGTPRPGYVQLNPLGRDGNVITYGMLCDIGFAMEPGQSAAFSHVEVAHLRRPGNVVFREGVTAKAYRGLFAAFAGDPTSGLRISDGAYVATGGTAGMIVTADPSRNAMPLLRTEFTTKERRIAAARLSVTARGIYEVYLNGRRVGEDYYNPGLSQYNKTHFYQTYDVTPLVANGRNALGAMLGEGWWSGLLSYGTIWNHFGDRQSLLAKLVVTYDDGTRETFVTNDRGWRYFGDGPTRYSSLTMGEVYDATREPLIHGWDRAGFDDHAWKKAVVVPLEGTTFQDKNQGYDALRLRAQIGDCAGVYKIVRAQSVREVRPHVYVYDLGQNIVGVPRIAFKAGRAGRAVTLRFAEILYPNLPASGGNVGMIMTENLRVALCQDIYVQRDGEQVWQPRFTSRGFQYIEITGIEEPLPLEAVAGVAISSVHDLTSSYESSNPAVNRLWSNLVWSNVDNFLTIPTDCPQRNERMGWSGDISVFSRTATYVSDTDAFLRRHLAAMRDVQSPEGRFTDIAPIGGGFGGVLWGSAGITVPWECYQQYGDRALLQEHYPAMAAYVRYLATTIDPATGLSRDSNLGDWLGPQNNQLHPTYLTTAYHIFDLDVMTRVAELLGRNEDAAEFRRLRAERAAFFNRTFVNAERKAISPARGKDEKGFRLSDTQTAYAVGLALGAFDDALRPAMAGNLAAAVERECVDDDGVVRPKYSLLTGFIGTAWISAALSDIGRSDLAYRQLQCRSYPSWLYPIDQGATTIWERLNGYTIENGFGGRNGMNSFNHYSFGAVGQWLIGHSLGIARGEPGFKHFELRPEPDATGQMTWARGYYDSLYGRIESAWRIDGDRLTYTGTVPPNTSATLVLPTKDAETVTESGQPASRAAGLRLIRAEAGQAIYELGSGRYEFSTRFR